MQAIVVKHGRKNLTKPNELSDEALMIAYRDGDQHAFRYLFERYAEAIYRTTLRIVGDEGEANDIVQQSFLQLHRARNDFNAKRRFRSWLYTIALNLARDELRRRKTRREKGRFVETLDLEASSPDVSVERGDNERRLHSALQELSPRQREVIVLHWYEGLSFPEIAESTGEGLSAVKVRASRAYKTLRSIFKINS